MLQRCGENLAEVLKGNIDPLTLIFPEGSVTHAESIYGNSPVSRLMNQRVAEAINLTLNNFLPVLTLIKLSKSEGELEPLLKQFLIT